MKKILSSALILSSVLVAHSANAANTATGQAVFNINLTIDKKCDISGGGNLAIQSNDLNEYLNAQSGTQQMRITCTKGADYKIVLAGARELSNPATTDKIAFDVLTGEQGKTLSTWAKDLKLSKTGTGQQEVYDLAVKITTDTKTVAPVAYAGTLTASIEF